MTTATWRYGGTGLSLADLDAKPRHEREAILAATLTLHYERRAELNQHILECESYLRDAMLARGATVADAGDWQVKLSPRRKWEYDVEHLSCLQAFVEPAQYERAIREVVTTKVDKRVLNELSKRGGDVAEIIQRACVEQVAGYDLEITARKGR